MKQILNIFAIRKEERIASLIAASFFLLLNVLQLAAYNNFTSANHSQWQQFLRSYHLSGFDHITYTVITQWSCSYNVHRHPLLAFFLWPFSQLNQLLVSLTGHNCAVLITALLLILCATYSVIFLLRIFHDIIGLRRSESLTLTALTFSFAYIMLSTIAPDHFGPSMMLLTLTLYIGGLKLTESGDGRTVTWWQTILLFTVTAGVSLNNGLKTFLMAFFVRRRRFFSPAYLVVAVLLPSTLMWLGARKTYATFVQPKVEARLEKQRQIEAKETAKQREIRLAKKKQRWEKSAAYRHTGKPIAQGEFMRWTDVTTSRTDAIFENLLGEGIMIHEDYLLGDVLVNRPVVVRYRWWGNYFVEAFLLLLFAVGVWVGRKKKFLHIALSFLLLDIVLHIVLGFGINEIYIMSAHYLYVIPIAIAYLLPHLTPPRRRQLHLSLLLLTIYLYGWNIALLMQFLMC